MADVSIDGYKWHDAELNASHEYFLPALFSELQKIKL